MGWKALDGLRKVGIWARARWKACARHSEVDTVCNRMESSAEPWSWQNAMLSHSRKTDATDKSTSTTVLLAVVVVAVAAA